MDVSASIYWRPSYPAPAVDKNRCPFCFTENFKSPGPCQQCGVHGYHDGPPGVYRGRVWRREGRDYEPQDEPGLEISDDYSDMN